MDVGSCTISIVPVFEGKMEKENMKIFDISQRSFITDLLYHYYFYSFFFLSFTFYLFLSPSHFEKHIYDMLAVYSNNKQKKEVSNCVVYCGGGACMYYSILLYYSSLFTNNHIFSWDTKYDGRIEKKEYGTRFYEIREFQVHSGERRGSIGGHGFKKIELCYL